MSEESEQTSEMAPVADILSTDLSGVDTSYPLLKPGNYEFEVVEIKSKSNKAKDGQILEIVFITTSPTTTVKGEELNPGHKLTDYIAITPKGKLTVENIQKSLKRFRNACLGTIPGSFAPLDQYIGSKVLAKVTVENDPEGKYDPQNRLRLVEKD